MGLPNAELGRNLNIIKKWWAIPIALALISQVPNIATASTVDANTKSGDKKEYKNGQEFSKYQIWDDDGLEMTGTVFMSPKSSFEAYEFIIRKDGFEGARLYIDPFLKTSTVQVANSLIADEVEVYIEFEGLGAHRSRTNKYKLTKMHGMKLGPFAKIKRIKVSRPEVYRIKNRPALKTPANFPTINS